MEKYGKLSRNYHQIPTCFTGLIQALVTSLIGIGSILVFVLLKPCFLSVVLTNVQNCNKFNFHLAVTNTEQYQHWRRRAATSRQLSLLRPQLSHVIKVTYEPCHEIVVLSVLRKLILQTCMRSHPLGLDVSCLVGPFVYFHTSCLRTAKALARLHGCAGSSEPSLVAYVISIIISWAGSFYVTDQLKWDFRTSIHWLPQSVLNFNFMYLFINLGMKLWWRSVYDVLLC